MLATLIKYIHIGFILFVLLVPFIGNEFLLNYHFITIPFLLMHWLTNNDTCALSLMESKLRGMDETQTFMGRLVKPVYNIQSRDFYIACVILFMITTYRLYYQYQFRELKFIIATFYMWYTQLKNKIISQQ